MRSFPYWVSLGLYLSCTPDFEDQASLVTEPRLIAVVAEPAEARPGQVVRLIPFVAGRQDTQASFDYRFCAQPPALADPRSVDERCADAEGIALATEPGGARGAVPAKACAQFGPDPVGSDFQPRDADATGGFYQPFAIDGLGRVSVGLLRITCPRPDVPVDLARELTRQYVENQNPTIGDLEREILGAWQSLVALTAGEQITLRVTWDDSTREQYVWLPPAGKRLEGRRESLRVAWFSSDGRFQHASTGRAEDDLVNHSVNRFTVPEQSGPLDVWAVIHDSRGGSGVAQRTVQVIDR